MKLKLKDTPQVHELIRAMASDKKTVAAEAREAFAAFIGPTIAQVLPQMNTSSMLFKEFTYDEDDSPSLALDLLYGTDVNHVQVWMQNIAGGLPSSLLTGISELKIATFRLDSAVSLLKKYVKRSRLDVVSMAISRMLAEIAVKIDRNAWAVLLVALAQASTNGSSHIITSTTQNILQLDDFNRLITKGKRMNNSWFNGTPSENYSNGITDLFMSPEMVEQVRGFAYQPMNTRGVPNSDESTAVPLPDSIREAIFRSAGTQSIFNIGIHSLNELGDGQKYNIVFGNYAPAGIAHGGANFNSATDQLVLGVDLTKDALFSPVAKNADSGSTLQVLDDDQFVTRSEKIGWFCSTERGYAVTDSRSVVGLIV